MLPRTSHLIALCAFLLLGCDQSSGPGVSHDVIFRHALAGTPASIDPAHASSVHANFLAVNLYDTLYRYKYLARPYELTPNLAVAMPEISADGRVYTIRIRPGTYFQDDEAFAGGKGREVVADDFIFSILRQFDPLTRPRGAWLWKDHIEGLKSWGGVGVDYNRPISGLKAVGKYTIIITLNEANPSFIYALAQGFAGIVPHEAIVRWGREFSSHPVGSGPFKLKSFNTTEAILVRNKDYRNEQFSIRAEGGDPETHADLIPLEGKTIPLADRVELPFIKNDSARWNALISDDVDSILAPSTLLTSILASDESGNMLLELKPSLADNYRSIASREAGFIHLDFNLSNTEIGYNPDPTRNAANHALRCAIRKSYDWEARNRTFSQGTGLVFAGIIPPIVEDYDPGFAPESIRYDPDGARALLKQHGWNAENLPLLTYGYAVSVTENQMFEQFRGFLMNIGYPADKVQARKFASFGDFMRGLNESDLNVVLSGWEMDYPDAVNTLQLFYGPNHTPGANHANFNNPEFDRLFRLSRNLKPSTKRRRLFAQLNRIVTDSCATISGLARTRIFIWNKRARVQPDRGFTGGYFLRFASVDQIADESPQ